MKLDKRLIIFSIITITWLIYFYFISIQEAFLIIKNNWQISLTMLFGSIVAGGSSVGGGAVAFPVFTKVLNISPDNAKIFSLAIQTVGMGAASLTIYFSKIKVDWKVILWGSLGGFFGIFIGTQYISHLLPPDFIKISFTLILTSFAITLFHLNKSENKFYNQVFLWNKKIIYIFMIAGFLGGIVSSLIGNGIDIFIFSVMVLLFRINEKVSTPTSVILMAINAFFGFMINLFFVNSFVEPITSYWLAAVPVVVIGAPLGSLLCNLISRENISNILIFLIFIELISSLIIIPLKPITIVFSFIILMIFSFINYKMYINPINNESPKILQKQNI